MVWDVPEGDAFAISLGSLRSEVPLRSCSGLGCTRYYFRVYLFLKCYCDHVVVLDVPAGDALVITLGFTGSRSATAIM